MRQRPIIKQITNKERLERLFKSGLIMKGSTFYALYILRNSQKATFSAA